MFRLLFLLWEYPKIVLFLGLVGMAGSVFLFAVSLSTIQEMHPATAEIIGYTASGEFRPTASEQRIDGYFAQVAYTDETGRRIEAPLNTTLPDEPRLGDT